MIRVIDHRLGFVAAMETFCTECDTVVNSTLSSDRIEVLTSGNEPFFTVRYAVSGSKDMGLGHSELVKLCCLLDTGAAFSGSTTTGRNSRKTYLGSRQMHRRSRQTHRKSRQTHRRSR